MGVTNPLPAACVVDIPPVERPHRLNMPEVKFGNIVSDPKLAIWRSASSLICIVRLQYILSQVVDMLASGWCLLLVVNYDKNSLCKGLFGIYNIPRIGSHQHQPPTLNMCTV